MAKGDEFVIAELHGRLGNQLFQFASSYAIARRRNARLLFASHEVAPADLLLPSLIGDLYVEASPRDLLRVGQVARPSRSPALLAKGLGRALSMTRRMRRRSPAVVRYKSDTGLFRPEVFDLDLPVYLKAHLESERYFADVRDEIRGAICWPDGAPELPISADHTVAVSFRRGDFNSLQRSLPLAYYERALEVTVAAVPSPHFVLFGDDVAFVQLASGWIERYGPVTNALEIGTDPITQLRLMATCQHAVIANSSFAWWGAWLGDERSANDARTVVAPEEYVGTDRTPPRWTTVSAGVALKVW